MIHTAKNIELRIKRLLKLITIDKNDNNKDATFELQNCQYHVSCDNIDLALLCLCDFKRKFNVYCSTDRINLQSLILHSILSLKEHGMTDGMIDEIIKDRICNFTYTNHLT